MNATAQKYGAPPLAGVNLIPVEIAERKKMRAVITAAVMAVIVAAALVAVAFGAALVAKIAVEADRDTAAQDEATALVERDAKTQVYYDVLAREQEEFTLAQIGYGEIDQADLAASIQQTANDDTSFEVIHVVGPNAQGIVEAGGDGDVYGTGIGTVEFTARATTLETATALLRRLENVPGLANVRGATESIGSDGAGNYWQIEGTAVLTDLLLTNRLIPTEGISDVAGVLAPIVEPDAEASASPSPEPTATEEG
ncbi:hypothetical protein [Demequina maris]|uniref:hypothetical protein n=1 Tax=Demequina maris TaxID=1638982 RepID=UPI00078074DE|nr:hypothetical protein [Demequina maris]